MKRIVICIDGTWSQFYNINHDEDPNWSNVHNMRTLVAERDKVRKIPQIVHYVRGVGTHSTPSDKQSALVQKFKTLNSLFDGMTGYGVNELIFDGYMCLCDNYEEGDEIYIFGFSRGAVAARALAGIIGLCGILKTDWIEDLPKLWAYIKALRTEQASTVKFALDDPKKVHSKRNVKCVGVWDTVRGNTLDVRDGKLTLAQRVAALVTTSNANGGRREAIKSETVVTHELDELLFSSQHIPANVEVAFHAISIDEQRIAYAPIPWTVKEGDRDSESFKQVLFAGDHCSVGGGHEDSSFSNLSLQWMMQSVQRATGLVFHTLPARFRKLPSSDSTAHLAPPSDWNLPIAKRAFKIDHDCLKLDDRAVVNCKIHASVLALYKNFVKISGDPREYVAPMMQEGSSPFELDEKFVEDLDRLREYSLQFGVESLKVNIVRNDERKGRVDVTREWLEDPNAPTEILDTRKQKKPAKKKSAALSTNRE
jgi:uncharacterized protein (DUF2235 family)